MSLPPKCRGAVFRCLKCLITGCRRSHCREEKGRGGGQGADGSSLGWDWNTVVCDLYLCVWGGGVSDGFVYTPDKDGGWGLLLHVYTLSTFTCTCNVPLLTRLSSSLPCKQQFRNIPTTIYLPSFRPSYNKYSDGDACAGLRLLLPARVARLACVRCRHVHV